MIMFCFGVAFLGFPTCLASKLARNCGWYGRSVSVVDWGWWFLGERERERDDLGE